MAHSIALFANEWGYDAACVTSSVPQIRAGRWTQTGISHKKDGSVESHVSKGAKRGAPGEPVSLPHSIAQHAIEWATRQNQPPRQSQVSVQRTEAKLRHLLRRRRREGDELQS